MFERYTERARRILFFARYEASQLGGPSIETEHILLGLIREGKGVTSQLLARARISFEDIRKEVEQRGEHRERLSTSVEIPFSAEVKRVLRFAADEADHLRHQHIGPEHVLLGLLREDRSVAGEILIKLGLRLEAVRQDVVALTTDDGTPRHELFFEVGPRREPHRGPLDIAPSYDLRVSRMSPDAAQGQFTSNGPDFFFAQGFTLRAILARLLNANERRIVMPTDLDTDERYEFKLRLPAAESWQAIERRVIEGITRHFDICVSQERRLLDVYVLTVRQGATIGLHRATEQDGGVGGGRIEWSTLGGAPPETGRAPAHRGSLHTIGPFSLSGSTLADLAGLLEDVLGQPVVDETQLGGRYDIVVGGNYADIEAFLAAIHDQLGLTVTRSRRELEMVVVQRR